jgi:hypothetical protein
MKFGIEPSQMNFILHSSYQLSSFGENLRFIDHVVHLTNSPAGCALNYHATKTLTVELSVASSPVLLVFKSPFPGKGWR